MQVNTRGPVETYKKMIINKIDRNEISNNIYWWSHPILPFLEAHYNMTQSVPTRSLIIQALDADPVRQVCV